MKRKFTVLIASLLLAVGWTNTASAQTLPKDSFADQLAKRDFKPYTGPIVNVMATPETPTLEQGIRAKAPTRATYERPVKVYPKSYYDTLTYSWSNPTTGQSGTDVPATELATDPYQIYQLLKFVYMDPRFPGPYYNACSSTNEAEDPVYYGGIEGGWNIPFGTTSGGDSEPVTYTYSDLTITTSSNWAMFTEITIADATTDEVLETWTQNTSVTNQTLPTGWTSSSTVTYNTSYSACCMGTSTGSATITISGSHLNAIAANHSSIRVYMASFKRSANYTETLTFAMGSTSANATLTTNSQRWYYDFSGASSTAVTETTPTDVLITASNGGIDFASITVTDATSGSTITSWSASNNGATLPTGWYSNKTLGVSNGYAYMNGGGTIRIASELFEGHNSITVTAQARFYSSSATNGTLQISNIERSWTLSSSSVSNCAATINFPAKVATDTYKPKEQGYTALIVQVKNNNTIYTEPSDYLGAWEFNAGDSTSLINYIGDNIKSVQLLTDGLRIGEGEGTGTVFNCSGTYNKFFFLGKGRARKKSSGVLASMGLSNYAWPSYACEEGPFKYMFEQFSPTGGEEGSQITDFYIEMMDGNVYDVVHDCASVIQNGHQFSMSGNTGTQEYAMSGMNFFIPDYRLKYWRNDSIGITTKTYQPNDGRDMNPYMVGDDNGKTGAAFDQASYFAVNFAQYNPQHSPKVGIYVITLDAEANPCSGYDPESNANYVVTLDWTSSLNEMSGHDVPQTYVIYEVITNEDGSTRLDSITTVEGQTHYDFGGQLWPQGEHSESHTYIIQGWPTDNDHPSFVAWSNEDVIVIPGLNDFLELGLTHFESDFDVPLMQNWYRNFLTVNNDGYVGLTTQGIFEGDSVFNLLRFENTDSTITKQVAQLKFENMNDGRVKYTINYVDENNANSQQIEAEKYDLRNMNIPTTGYLTTKSAGDIMIQPNGYDVNFLKITVTAGNYSQTWTSPAALPNGWSVSDGSMWVLENGAYYLEGGGYILIPAAILGTYTTATVTINAYGDAGKTAKIKVNNDTKSILNGDENARDYTWTVNNGTAGNLNFNASQPEPAPSIPFAALTSMFNGTTNNATSFNAPRRATTDELTVFDGTTYVAQALPIIGVYHGSYSQHNQMIYPASLLTNMAGKTITSMTFYPTSYTDDNYNTYNGMNFSGGSVTFKLANLSSGSTGYDSSSPQLITGTMTPVKTIVPQSNSSATTWVIEFDTPFEYNGGDLLIDVTNAIGSNGATYFAVGTDAGISYPAYIGYSTQAAAISYLPKVTFTYTDGGGNTGPIQPTVDGVVRMANLRIVDQFAEEIPPTNDHPYRYTYYLKLKDSEEGEKESSMVPVPVQHTGADVQGYYTLTEMNNDVDPENFLQENVISAQVDMNLSPTSAPYFYTINSVKDNVPPKADDYNTYVSVLQRRSAGDYQEMQASGKILGESSETAIPNPERNRVYESGNHNFFDYRKVTGETEDYLSYVPIIWTNGINRHYYVQDSLHNSYGAPIWKVKRGDVQFSGYVQRQVSSSGGWNPSVNWYVKNADGTDSTAYSLYFAEFNAIGVLPAERTADYEPYMFRVWLVDSTESLRNYEWQYSNGKPVKIIDAGARPGKWFLLDEKMCADVNDLQFQRTITTDYANNLQFAGPLNNFKPELKVRFYYKKKGQAAPNSLRGMNDDNNVGYVVIGGVRPDPETAVHELQIVGEIVGQTYYNAQGMQSDKPFEGINIVVTRYSDGTTSTSKVRY